jgi:benzoyl-CoA 2,3-dioxygenase component B
MIDYTDKIPNNVDLGRDRVLQRALEHWQPAYLSWWYDMGPNESHNFEVYLRTAVSVEPDGWAQFDYIKMPEYRWGIFLQPRDEKRQVNFGIHKGQSAWQDVPGEYRSILRRIIVTQGDTEPASVEQQKMLGLSCPSLYDLRNIFSTATSDAMAVKKPNPCSRAAPVTPIIRASSALSTSPRPTGSPSTCLPSLPTATASSSFAP